MANGNGIKELLTNSSMKVFRACHKKYLFMYEMLMKTVKESEPLYFGNLWHEAVAEWCKNGLKSALALVHKLSEGKDQDFVKVTVIALLEGYSKKYESDDYEILEIEREFLAPLLNPETMQPSRIFDLAGKLDGIYAQNKRKMIVERKTTSENIDSSSDYWTRLQLDPQISVYYIGAQALGYEVESCLYDVVKKPTSRPYKATPEENRKYKKDGTLYANMRETDETVDEYYWRIKADIALNPDKYFARREVPRSESDLRDYLSDVWEEAHALREMQLNKHYSRNPDSCITVFGQCPYFGVCAGMADINDETLFQKSETKHKELTGKAA